MTASAPTMLQNSLSKCFRWHRAFVRNCFWHQHSGCRLWRLPGSRLEYWRSKLERTIESYRQAQAGLRAVGWGVLVIWESETRDGAALQGRIRAFFRRLGDWPG